MQPKDYRPKEKIVNNDDSAKAEIKTTAKEVKKNKDNSANKLRLPTIPPLKI